MIYYSEIRERNGYVCELFRATCNFLDLIGASIRSKDLERTYGLFEYQLSEIFWEDIIAVYYKLGYTIELRHQIKQQIAQIYANDIHDKVHLRMFWIY